MSRKCVTDKGGDDPHANVQSGGDLNAECRIANDETKIPSKTSQSFFSQTNGASSPVAVHVSRRVDWFDPIDG